MSAPGQPIITFRDGLPGFEACRHFVLVTSPDLEPFACLHGIGEGAPSFLAIDPRRADPAFDMALDPSDHGRIGRDGGTPARPLLWLALVRAGSDAVTVNLRAPLIINPETMLGVQVVRADSGYATDAPLLAA